MRRRHLYHHFCLPLLLLVLAGCAPQQPRGWRQHHLADPGLPGRSEAELSGYASQLKLPP